MAASLFALYYGQSSAPTAAADEIIGSRGSF